MLCELEVEERKYLRSQGGDCRATIEWSQLKMEEGDECGSEA